jgi:hypothetical protein
MERKIKSKQKGDIEQFDERSSLTQSAPKTIQSRLQEAANNFTEVKQLQFLQKKSDKNEGLYQLVKTKKIDTEKTPLLKDTDDNLSGPDIQVNKVEIEKRIKILTGVTDGKPFGNSKTVAKYWKDREQANKGFDSSEINALDFLDKSDSNGWLQKTGFFNEQQSRIYLEKGNFKDWQSLTPQKRMLIAYYSSDFKAVTEMGNPATWLRDSLYSGFKRGDAFEQTQKIWEETIKAPTDERLAAASAHKDKDTPFATMKVFKGADDSRLSELAQAHAKFVERVFIILQNSKINVLKENGDTDEGFKSFETPISELLSHGGRTNIILPKLKSDKDDPHQIADWLGITKRGKQNDEIGAYRRQFATHDLRRTDDGEHVKEGKGITSNFRNFTDRELSRTGQINIGLDISMGGIGNLDFNGELIMPDGGHGHFFVQYKPPTQAKVGAIMIGLETTAPSQNRFGTEHDAKYSPIGQKHGLFSSEKTAATTSLAGGTKGNVLGAKVNGRIADLRKGSDKNISQANVLSSLKAFEAKLNEHYTEEQKIKKLIGPQMH